MEEHGRKSISHRPGKITVVSTVLVITRQIKAARSLIGWEQHQLALNSGVAISTVRRLEGMNGAIGARLRTIKKIRRAFEEAGIEFIGDPNPGVRLRASHE
jgi:transcriptional regulator with XRE-family HTH domain